MKKIQITISDEMYEIMNEEAKMRGVGVSAVGREIIKMNIKKRADLLKLHGYNFDNELLRLDNGVSQ